MEAKEEEKKMTSAVVERGECDTVSIITEEDSMVDKVNQKIKNVVVDEYD